MAEVLLQRRLGERGIDATVSSAGFLPEGYPAMDDAVASVADAGLDLAGHTSTTVTRELLGSADLVIAMERQHVVDLAVLSPDAWPRIFQVRDLVRRAENAGRRAPDRPIRDWLAELGAGRTPADVLTEPLADDIPDPVAGPRSGYDLTRQILDDLLTRLVVLIA
jgi:protein-tyrosine-phosphatase